MPETEHDPTNAMICSLCHRMFTPFNAVARDLNGNCYCVDCAVRKLADDKTLMMLKNIQDAEKEESL